MEKLLQDLINLFGQMMPELSTIDEDYGQLEMINQENRDTYPLTRSGSRFYTWDHGIKVYEQTYSCVVTEMLEPETEAVQAQPRVTVRLMNQE